MLDDFETRLPQVGRLDWIGRADHKRGRIEELQEAVLRPGTGIDGEHHATGGHSKREVTLIQNEHLPAIAALAGRAAVGPELLRRNLVISGINLIALKGRKFTIGEVLLEGTGACAPCSRMEENLGPGGFNAMRGHGGLTAVVLEGGTIRVGDAVRTADQRS
ncbi:MAG: MOSC domain-containing protein [Planctomycetes bacterium]|nr:MOSC domain-containing protein [Planctomycetota bacterium]